MLRLLILAGSGTLHARKQTVRYPADFHFCQGEDDDCRRSKDSADGLPRAHRQEWARATDRQRQGQPEGHQDLEVQDGRGRKIPPRQLHPQSAALHRRRAAGVCWATTLRPIRPRPRSPRSAPASPSACTPTPCIAAGSSTSSSSSSRAISTSPRSGAPATSRTSRSASPTYASRSTWNARGSRRRDQCAGRPCEAMVARSPTPSPARSILTSASRRQPGKVRETFTASPALSRAEVLVQPAPPIAGEVARIRTGSSRAARRRHRRRHRLSGRRAAPLGEVGAWGSHMPHEGAGRPALRHPGYVGDRRGLRQHRLHGVVPEHAGLVRRQLDQYEARRALRRCFRPAACSAAPGSPIR